MTISVRPALEADLAAVRTCLAAAFEPYRATYTPGAILDTVATLDDLDRRLREMTVLVAEAEGAGVVGTVALHLVAPSLGYLRGMAVLPSFQGRGVAARLLSAAETELRSRGCARVTLDTTRPLERAIRFYERQGYRATGAVKDFHGMPLYEYEKRL